MANPVTVSCPEGDWQIVATAVKAGQVSILNNAPTVYRHTYRLTGEAVPTDDLLALPFADDDTLPISAAEEVDVYVKAVGANGLVLVEL